MDLNRLKFWKRNTAEVEDTPVIEEASEDQQSEVYSSHSDRHDAYRGNYVPIRQGNFHGEKTPGELGSVYDLRPSYRLLRMRAYEAKLTNDVIAIITNKFFRWVVGSGLKAQAEPNERALKTEKISKVPEVFRDDCEARFEVFANSTMCDYEDMENLHTIAANAFETAFFGDCLVVLRVEGGYPKVQLIDGEHVKTPFLDDKTDWEKEARDRGNVIRNGIEMDAKKKHVAYFVSVEIEEGLGFKFERIPAYGARTKRKMAWLISLKKHRIDNDRGIPLLTPVLEKVTKIDRYTEAAVGTAEERAKMVYAIEHSKDSDGTNPLLSATRAASGMGKNAAPETEGYELGNKTATTIAATTSKQTFNLPVGAKLQALYSQNEIQYETFWKAIFKSLCAAVDIPPEVALQEYNSNYSASRAAIKSWEYIIKIYRAKFSEKFYTPFYQLWLHTEILKGKINAPGYLQNSTNFMVVESYARVRFQGQNMPHIDPVKEVKAVVNMLDKELISHEQATEMLNAGDWMENYGKLKKENKKKGSEKPKPAAEDNPKLKVASDA